MIDPHWLKDKYKYWTDEMLHECYRDIAMFGGSQLEMAEVSTEYKRRISEQLNNPELRKDGSK